MLASGLYTSLLTAVNCRSSSNRSVVLTVNGTPRVAIPNSIPRLESTSDLKYGGNG
ncbi:uncharacterized protein PGTG_21595 [Puccinia graminis f. sp. tritici CRL 75-36-700-3]|uniref:Uncharacterized protein n=1 Tax=Puccinia graminis f. sp. tritici (strain CRL 75-36-700-3 / race SCCL) TaxID=418459 RepID=H6QRY0_PUCGT|nr:uncharacterized protein PGTG_21595 [Puccinia graminis f. sp. tritici CRL 75-36-700-3]EHS63464.1 hypothetical protein PGTG_21595 [Puccinia graminis f. sp. tritici CRL 75-36-700-3]